MAVLDLQCNINTGAMETRRKSQLLSLLWRLGVSIIIWNKSQAKGMAAWHTDGRTVVNFTLVNWWGVSARSRWVSVLGLVRTVLIGLPGSSEFFDLLTNFACSLIHTVPGLTGGAFERLVREIKHGNNSTLKQNDVSCRICTNQQSHYVANNKAQIGVNSLKMAP